MPQRMPSIFAAFLQLRRRPDRSLHKPHHTTRYRGQQPNESRLIPDPMRTALSVKEPHCLRFTATILIDGFVPSDSADLGERVPPVPTALMKRSIVRLWHPRSPVPWPYSGCPGCPERQPGRDVGVFQGSIPLALAIALFIPRAPSVNTSSAPSADRSFLRSMLIVSGIVMMSRYPFTAATIASPKPVLPLVGSMITLSLFNSPVSPPFDHRRGGSVFDA